MKKLICKIFGHKWMYSMFRDMKWCERCDVEWNILKNL